LTTISQEQVCKQDTNDVGMQKQGFRRHKSKASTWLNKIAKRYPELFVHWQMLFLLCVKGTVLLICVKGTVLLTHFNVFA